MELPRDPMALERVQIGRMGWEAVRCALARGWGLSQADGDRDTGLGWRVLELIVRVAWWRGKQSGGPAYAQCSEAWVAERLGCARETVSAHVVDLASRGLLVVVHRRRVKGEWQTNLYKVGGSILVAILRFRRGGSAAAAPQTAKPELSVDGKSHGDGGLRGSGAVAELVKGLAVSLGRGLAPG